MALATSGFAAAAAEKSEADGILTVPTVLITPALSPAVMRSEVDTPAASATVSATAYASEEDTPAVTDEPETMLLIISAAGVQRQYPWFLPGIVVSVGVFPCLHWHPSLQPVAVSTRTHFSIDWIRVSI
jgi:hypothetical protein